MARQSIDTTSTGDTVVSGFNKTEANFVELYNRARVGSVDGVSVADGGNIDIIGTGGISVTADNTADTITFDGSGISGGSATLPPPVAVAMDTVPTGFLSGGALPVASGGYQVLENDRVLLLNTTNSYNNGPWIAHGSSNWTRPTDFDASGDLYAGMEYYVLNGRYARTKWQLTTVPPYTLGTTNLRFERLGPQVQMLTAGQAAPVVSGSSVFFGTFMDTYRIVSAALYASPVPTTNPLIARLDTSAAQDLVTLTATTGGTGIVTSQDLSIDVAKFDRWNWEVATPLPANAANINLSLTLGVVGRGLIA